MRAAIRSLLVVVTIAATVVAGQAGVMLTASTTSDGYFDIASVLPVRDAVVGVAHPVVVTFRHPVTSPRDRGALERAIEVKSVPAMTGRFEWQDDTVVHWVPDRFWPAHTTIALSVGGLRTDFKTGPAVVGIADTVNHTFTVSIDGVEAETPPLPAPHHRPHFGEPGVLPATMGRPEYETPVGTYSVLAKDRSVTMDSSSVGIPVNDSDGYLLKVDYAVRITNRGLYVHSAPWAVAAMGAENVSHGCISLTPTDAEWYFDTVHVGDPVIVREGVPAVNDDKEADQQPSTLNTERPPS
ncbi:L,D-transpeptidase [Mycobacterium asiaticum]|uniref:L,D-transpeptidase n=1 Tax=Mycobacterium asiaticum TaxID=1790 RepID=UPI0009BE6747|nr:L,D-transpeptidase [Mycobacterium asiaticum]